VYFTNAEGAELGMLEELIAKPSVWSRIRQMSVAFHEKICGRNLIREIVTKMASYAEIIVGGQDKAPRHLFVNRSPIA
jgi:hypothetical protein